MNIEIYSKDNCPFCDKAVFLAEQLVKKSHHEYVVHKLGVDFQMSDMLELFPTARTFPQIVLDGKNIGGYTEFSQLIK
jgi:glutaredoxin 3